MAGPAESPGAPVLPLFLRKSSKSALREQERLALLAEAETLRRLGPDRRLEIYFELVEFARELDSLSSRAQRDRRDAYLAREATAKFASYTRLRRGLESSAGP